MVPTLEMDEYFSFFVINIFYVSWIPESGKKKKLKSNTRVANIDQSILAINNYASNCVYVVSEK